MARTLHINIAQQLVFNIRSFRLVDTHIKQKEGSRIMRVFCPKHAFLSVGFTALQRKTSNDSLIQRVDKNEHEFKNGGF